MSQRIRYATIAAGILRSRRNFVTGSGQEVIVELDLDNKKYRILDSVSGEEVASGSGRTRNKSVLKIHAKRALTELGVVFAPEARQRGEVQVGG